MATQANNSKKIKERSVETYLCRRVKDLGGLCVKMDASVYAGIPDRLVILNGHMFFVELKRPSGGVISVRQKLWMKMLAQLDHEVHLVRTRDDVENLIGRILGHEKQLR